MTVGANVKGCYYAIKNAEATLEQLTLKTTHPDVINAYKDAQQILHEVKQSLHKQVMFLAREEPQY